eukprot:gene4523-5300_t
MFALQNLRGDSLAFKVDKELFLGHVDRPGIHPAPYLARAQWIIMETPYPLGAEELRGLLQRSHQLVVSKLPKRTQVDTLRVLWRNTCWAINAPGQPPASSTACRTFSGVRQLSSRALRLSLQYSRNATTLTTP